MKRPLLLTALLTIVPAIRPAIAAPPVVSDDVPVPGGIAAFTELLRIDPAPDRGRFMSEVTRILLENDPQRTPEIAAARLRAINNHQSTINNRDLVPVPLTAGWWSDHVFHRHVARDELVAAIVSDRQAAMICHGLTALDDETLEYFAEHGSVISRLVEKLAAAPFAAFSSHLRIRTNRIAVVPEESVALWEAALDEKASRPDRFIELLFETDEGRIAYLFDTIGQLDPARRAFALGLWMPSATARVERFKLLVAASVNGLRDWHVRAVPLGRASYDIAMALARVDASEAGAPASPLRRSFWIRAVQGREPGAADEELPFDAAWVAEAMAGDVHQRRERLDQFAFAQRLVRSVRSERDIADAQLVIRSFSRFRMLFIALERMGITRPAVYVAALNHATRLASFDRRRGFVLEAQFQGALALVARASAVRTLDAATSESLVERLTAVPIADEGRYAGALAAWMRESLLRAIPRGADAESAIVAALSGGTSGDPNRPALVAWEGQQYRLDLGAAERQRLQRVREKQDAIPLDLALAVLDAGRQLAGDPSSAPAVAARLAELAANVPRWPTESAVERAPAGLAAAPSYADVLRKTADEIKTQRSRDARRLGRTADAVVDLGDDMLASSLVSLVYAIDLGDPDGTILLADDVSWRHDFGFAMHDDDDRRRAAWEQPREQVLPNAPWHVSGSLVGLDIALAPLALRRVNSEGVLEAPRLTGPERDAFALSVSLMNPFRLRDSDRDAIADAVARGTRRAQLATARTIDAIADELSLDSGRRRALRWTVAHEPARAVSMLTMTELLVLGGAHPEAFPAWGMAAAGPAGCICTQLATPAGWAPMARRPQLGLTAALVADLNLHVAVMLKQLQLPAALARVVLSAAAQDFIDAVKPTDPGDWLTLARTARAPTRERMEDYVAAATAAGPLIPVTSAQQH